VQINSSQWYD